MTLQIENETDLKPDFDYEKEAERIINFTLDYLDCPYETEINLTLTDNDGIREANNSFRSIDKVTDVLSFPLVDYIEPACFDGIEDRAEDYFNLDTGELMLGDILICVPRMYEQAEEYGHSVLREFCFLIVHSMLHLFGYDHMEEDERLVMEELQRNILDAAGITR